MYIHIHICIYIYIHTCLSMCIERAAGRPGRLLPLQLQALGEVAAARLFLFVAFLLRPAGLSRPRMISINYDNDGYYYCYYYHYHD